MLTYTSRIIYRTLQLHILLFKIFGYSYLPFGLQVLDPRYPSWGQRSPAQVSFCSGTTGCAHPLPAAVSLVCPESDKVKLCNSLQEGWLQHVAVKSELIDLCSASYITQTENCLKVAYLLLSSVRWPCNVAYQAKRLLTTISTVKHRQWPHACADPRDVLGGPPVASRWIMALAASSPKLK